MSASIAVMLVNYFHDLAAGVFFGAVAVFYSSHRALAAAQGEADQVEAALHDRLRPVVLGSLALVVLGGFPRAYFYADYEWLPAAGNDQIPVLVAKHVVLVGASLLSLAFFLRRRPGSAGR